MAGTMDAVEPVGKAADGDGGGKAGRIDFRDRRREQEIDAGRRADGARSAASSRGYLAKSSCGPNCAGLTNRLTTVRLARRRARATSAMCPSCSAPMVGTRATVSPRLRHCATARRKAATVRTVAREMQASGIRNQGSETPIKSVFPIPDN